MGNLARQISVTAHAHLLGLRLEQARLRLVTERGEARRQLGRDLHDDVGHQLTALVQQLEQLKSLVQENDPGAQSTLSTMNRQLVHLTTHVRELAHKLFPPELELLGLVGALQERILTHQSLKIILRAPGDLPFLPAEIETAVYYIALEALTNIEKHAQAQSCQIDLSLHPTQLSSMLKLTIRDDGRGLTEPPLGGIGLLSMQARAAEVGGTFAMDTVQGAGTTISVHIPCPVTMG
jgi:signal transduction histidine kinase